MGEKTHIESIKSITCKTSVYSVLFRCRENEMKGEKERKIDRKVDFMYENSNDACLNVNVRTFE